jgi:hypothetical protein
LFIKLANIIVNNNGGNDVQMADNVFKLHPSDLAYFLELEWDYAQPIFKYPNESPAGIEQKIPETLTRLGYSYGENSYLNKYWFHLIYAYMIENTRVYEIFFRVIKEYLYSEKLGIPQEAIQQQWLRSTEELFYKNPPVFSIYSLASDIRPDTCATRRNAYYRMFGMDITHGTDADKTYPYEKPKAANRDFTSTFEDFLTEIWIAIKNINNSGGENPTDVATVANLANRLHNMFIDRRGQTANLSREEFYAVALMSWFHLSLGFLGNGQDYISPIVKALSISSSSPAERLSRIGERVGLGSHKYAENFFELAVPMSAILNLLESQTFDSSNVMIFYTPSSVENDIRTIITHWSIATGHNLKEAKMRVSG